MDLNARVDNPWANYIGVRNCDDFEKPEPPDLSNKPPWIWLDSENTKLSSDVMNINEKCPVWEEWNFVMCKLCGYLLLSSVLKNHLDIVHKNDVVETSESNAITASVSNALNLSASCSGTVPSEEQRSRWPYCDSSARGAFPLPLPEDRNSPMNLVKVKTKRARKAQSTNYDEDFGWSSSSSSSSIRTPESVSPTQTLLHRLELSLCQQARLMLPELSSSTPSTSPDLSPSTSTTLQSFQPNFYRGREAMFDYAAQANQPSSTTSFGSPDPAKEDKKPPIEKMVLRRVTQTGEVASDEKRKSVEGQGGSRKKSTAQYFMVVNKNKESSQGLLHTSKQLIQQTHKIYKDKNIVDSNMKFLNIAKDKLITKLFMELQSMKKKLNQSKRCRRDLRSKLLVVSEKLKEIKRISDSQCEVLARQNIAYEQEIKLLKSKLDQISTEKNQSAMFPYFSSSDQQYFPNDPSVGPHNAQQLQSPDDQKQCFERRLRDLEAEIMMTNRSKQKLEIETAQFYELIKDLKNYHQDSYTTYDGAQPDGYYPMDIRSSSETPDQYSSPTQSDMPESTTSVPEGFGQAGCGAIDYRTYHQSQMISGDLNQDGTS